MGNNSKRKYDFITDLLETRKLNLTQKERILMFATKELKKDFSDKEEIEKRLKMIEDKLKKGIDLSQNYPTKPTSLNPTNKDIGFHKPKEVSKFLEQFKDNTALKWTTHAWDEKKYETIQLFIDDLNTLKDESFHDLYKCNRGLYFLLNYFLFNPRTELDESNMPKFGWSARLRELKIGWQFPNNLLIKWCEENYDHKNENIQYPFQFKLPISYQPKNPINGKMISTFENVVDVFKTEIQFRDNYLYKEIKKRTNKISDYRLLGIEKLKNIDFYTYTSGFLNAFDIILSEIKKNELDKDIEFSYQMLKDELFIDITHLNSYPTRKVNTQNPSQFLGGGMNAIAGHIFSLCDFSIISRFKDQNNNILQAEIMVAHDETMGKWKGREITIFSEPKVNELDMETKGFTYRFKFYL